MTKNRRVREHPPLLNNMDLTKISTKKLVEELQRRNGVKTVFVEPYDDKTVSVNGPATIVVVID